MLDTHVYIVRLLKQDFFIKRGYPSIRIFTDFRFHLCTQFPVLYNQFCKLCEEYSSEILSIHGYIRIYKKRD